MAGSSKKIFQLIICTVLLVFGRNILADSASQLQNAELRTFTVPKYNAETKKLEYILTGKNAQTVGTKIKIDDAKVDIIGEDGKSIEIVITTPEAFYDRVAENITGDKDVHYRSLQMDADGVGFNINNLNQTIHVDKDVKMWIYQHGRGKAVDKNSKIDSETGSDTAVSENEESNTNNKEHGLNGKGIAKDKSKDQNVGLKLGENKPIDLTAETDSEVN